MSVRSNVRTQLTEWQKAKKARCTRILDVRTRSVKLSTNVPDVITIQNKVFKVKHSVPYFGFGRRSRSRLGKQWAGGRKTEAR